MPSTHIPQVVGAPHCALSRFGILNGSDCNVRSFHWSTLKERLESRTARVVVVGLGYVGLPLAKVGDALNHFEESIRGSSILLLGVTYKPDVADIRESPAFDIMLMNKGAKISYNDPFIPEIAVDDLDMASEHLSAKLLESKDCVVIATNHSEYDAELIVKHSGCVVDHEMLPKMSNRRAAES